jgi:hypothetical protein
MVFMPILLMAGVGLALWLRPWPLYPATKPEPDGQTHNVAFEFTKWVERHARARGLEVRGVARPISLECPKCHRSSNYFVYPDELCERCWRASLKPLPPQNKLNRA